MRLAPMFRSFNMLMLLILIGVMAWTFKVKHDSREVHARVVELEQQIKAQEIEIDLFRSDWSLLTSPSRLEKLAERYNAQLGLAPMEPSQLADENNLPPLKSELPRDEPLDGEDFAGMIVKPDVVAIPVRRAQ